MAEPDVTVMREMVRVLTAISAPLEHWPGVCQHVAAAADTDDAIRRVTELLGRSAVGDVAALGPHIRSLASLRHDRIAGRMPGLGAQLADLET